MLSVKLKCFKMSRLILTEKFLKVQNSVPIKITSFTGNTCELRGNLIGSNQAVNSLDFDSTGTLILGTSNDFASRVWGIADHRLRVSKKSHFLYFRKFFFISRDIFIVLLQKKFTLRKIFFLEKDFKLEKTSAKNFLILFCVFTSMLMSHG